MQPVLGTPRPPSASASRIVSESELDQMSVTVRVTVAAAPRSRWLAASCSWKCSQPSPNQHAPASLARAALLARDAALPAL
jgi:hypothetical protein